MIRIRLLLVGIAVIALAILACDEKVFTGKVDCATCYQEEPEWDTLFVHLTFTDSIDEIPLVLYVGNYEENNIDYIDTAWVENGNPYWVTVDVDKEYSVRAEYRLPDKTIYAVDGTRLQTKRVTDVCETECWVIVDNTLDLKIKEEFLK
jgi:hypothetical protein